MSKDLHFSAEEEAILLQKAKDRGVPLEKMLGDIALRMIEEPRSAPPEADEPLARSSELDAG